jgi:CPA1 family monovalent cation:H+ antiporter
MLPPRLRIPPQWTAILAWGGLRGALSMVLALSLPESFPNRDILINMTFGVVILSILAQGVTVGPALRWLRLTGPTRVRATYSETQAVLLGAYSALDELGRTGGRMITDEVMRHALAVEYEERIKHAEQELGAVAKHVGGVNGGAPGTAPLATRRLLYDTERQRVLDAFHSGAMTEEASNRLLAELDTMWWDIRPQSDS